MDGHVWLKRVMLLIIIIIALSGVKFINLYQKAYAPNIFTPDKDDFYLYIRTGWNYEDVIKTIDEIGLVRNLKSFEWVAEKKNYSAHIYPGRYLIHNRMSNSDLINLLRSGKQMPLDLTFNNLRTLKQLTDRISEQLELSPDTLLALLLSDSIQKKYKFDKYTINCMFIPNTYEVYWNVSPSAFLDRMYKEYNSFWNKRRRLKAENMGMTREEVMTLASIVNEETRKNDEKKRVAGVYVNRLNKSMRLQADPTVIYGLNNFNIKRVLRKHYQLASPFNTYLNDGLPPGPICFPDISSIDAVLNYEKHNYYYFCAKPDFSGYHSFASTLSEHNRNAELYRRELNKRRIYR
jgi:UPF0755 protein